ncbi:MAG: acyltransferase [Tannerellaceae bacterium]|jgi:hypothetical protein|nr:acyltransferase [Tannerellaceae bacterium]
MKDERFDDLRPYYDEEVPEAMNRIAENEYFSALVLFIYPGMDVERVRAVLRSHTSVSDFQFNTMKDVNERVITRSIRHFTYEGIGELDRTKSYLFVSNHRDIMLDSSLLQYALFRSGYPTTEISFGSNLMRSQLMIDIGRSNKMFKVMRGGNAREVYRNSLHLSEYLRYTIMEKCESAWIAQRNGRTKDGYDATDQGIVKLFTMACPSDPIQALKDLNIVPVSISYGWEPCDRRKAYELYTRKRTGVYVKEPDEDVKSIILGLMQYKGDVHICVGEPLAEDDLERLRGCSLSMITREVAALIDDRIRRNYRLGYNNFIAYDLLNKSKTYALYYTLTERREFMSYLRKTITRDTEDPDLMREIFLRIYANPIRYIR